MPLCLLSLELTTAMPDDGGLVSWVEKAFGTDVGGHNTYWVVVSYVVDSAIYPVLAGEYIIDEIADESGSVGSLKRESAIALFASAIVLFVLGTKLAGTDWLVRFSTLLAAIAVLPIMIYVLWGLKELEPSQWVETKHPVETDWPLLVSWELWLYSGFVGISAMAGEVENPRRSFTIMIASLLPMLMLMNAVPLMVSLGIDDNVENYEAGYLDVLADKLTDGKWLGWMFTIGAQVVMVGLFNSQSIVSERSAAQFFKSRISETTFRRWESRGPIWHWLLSEAQHGISPIFIVANAALNLALVWVPYDLLVEMGMLMMTVPAFLLCAAFLYFRYTKPNMARTYSVPGGWVGAWVCALLPAAATAANLYYSVVDETPVFNVVYLRLYLAVAITGFGVVVHTIYNYWYARYNYGNGQPTDSTPLMFTPGKSEPLTVYADKDTSYF